MFTIDPERCIRCGSCIKACPLSLFTQGEDGSISAAQKECLNCFHCSATCPVRAIGLSELDQDALYPAPAPAGTLLARLQQRRSIRHFRDVLPARAVIQAALDGAAYAPSAKNQQACQWTVVLGREKVAQLYDLALDWAKDSPEFRHLVWLKRRGMNPVTCDAPSLLLVHAQADSHNPYLDTAIAMTLAEQLLADSGLGTCWGGYLLGIVNRCTALKAVLGLPEDHVVGGVLMLGYPDEHYPNTPHRPAARIRWVE